jgi:iron complex transport system ATP-binding protein
MGAAALLQPHPVRAFDVVISRIQDLTPLFRRITFAGPALDRFGVPGPALDLRIKLLMPLPGHSLTRPGTPDGQLHEGWYQDWLRREQPGGGFIRSYTVRALRTAPAGRELDVDFVIHPSSGGHEAPGSDWARAAIPGTPAVLIGPDASANTGTTRRSETGIRWDPQRVRDVLLAGDETALPAINSILETLPADVTGHAFLEVPDRDDFQDISTGSAVCITWLARNPSGAPRGDLLSEAVRAAHQVKPSGHMGAQATYAWVAAEAGNVMRLLR